MELKQLEYFIKVAQLSSLTKAADVLYTTQPHVSLVIRSLEKELGVTLFHRHSKGMELTEDGIRIYSYAENALKNVDTIRHVSLNTGKNQLKIASNPSSYMASLLTAYYPKLETDHVTLQYTECGIEEMMNLMSKEQYDLGFVFAPLDRKFALNIMAQRRHLEYVELFQSDLVVHLAPDHPLYGSESIEPEVLSTLNFIQLEEDYFTMEELLHKDRSKPLLLKSVISTNSDHMMIQMLKTGKVCNLGSFWIQNRFREYNFDMIPVKGYENSISFGYLKHRGHPLRPNAACFMDYVLAQLDQDQSY